MYIPGDTLESGLWPSEVTDYDIDTSFGSEVKVGSEPNSNLDRQILSEKLSSSHYALGYEQTLEKGHL